MQAEVLKAQADTLNEWAGAIERSPAAPEGSTEVAFLLRRASRLMRSIATGTPFIEHERVPPAEVTEVREG